MERLEKKFGVLNKSSLSEIEAQMNKEDITGDIYRFGNSYKISLLGYPSNDLLALISRFRSEIEGVEIEEVDMEEWVNEMCLHLEYLVKDTNMNILDQILDNHSKNGRERVAVVTYDEDEGTYAITTNLDKSLIKRIAPTIEKIEEYLNKYNTREEVMKGHIDRYYKNIVYMEGDRLKWVLSGI